MKSKQEHLQLLKEELDPWLPVSGDTHNLLEPISEATFELEQEMGDAKEGLRIQTANTKEEIRQNSYALGKPPAQNESVEEYRSRILASFQRIGSKGVPETILNYTSSVLSISKRNISIEENPDSGTFDIVLPFQAAQNVNLSKSQAGARISALAGSSYAANVIFEGDLDYVTEAEFTNGNYDTSDGYATLDADGNVTSGGTYSARY